MIWIDLVFACVRFARAAYAAFRPEFVDPSAPSPRAQAAGAAVFIWATAVPPVGLAAVGIVWIIEPQYPGGLFGALVAERGVVLWIAVQIAIRAYQLAKQPTRPLGEGQGQALRTVFENGLLNLLYRGVVLGALAVVFYAFGRSGFLVFVVLAVLFTIYVELHENWFGTLLRRFQARHLPR